MSREIFALPPWRYPLIQKIGDIWMSEERNRCNLRDRFKRWHASRKKGLKNPVILWFGSLTVTFLLTVLPSALVFAFSLTTPSEILKSDIWIKVIMDNLYPMMITQSAVTAIQNFSIISPSGQSSDDERKTPYFGKTVVLVIALLVYVMIFPILALADPPWKNMAMLICSGALAGFGLFSILQMDREQERIRVAMDKAKQVRNIMAAGYILGHTLENPPEDPQDRGEDSSQESKTPTSVGSTL